MAITCELCKKRAQIFTVNGQFTPTKASVYLRTALYDNNTYFNLSDTPVFEAANFLNREEGLNTKIYATEYVVSPSSKTAMISDSNGGPSMAEYPILSYPIKAGITGDYDVYIRRLNAFSFDANILLDGVVQDTISDGTSGTYTWSMSTITISDTNVHTLGIQIGNNLCFLDQIMIQPNGSPAPIGAQEFTDSPYNTVHAQLYTVTGDSPNTPLAIHDYKTTLTEIANDGWYNFDLNFLTTAGVTAFNDENYALVLFSSGAREKNFVSWELVDSNEYLSLPVAAES